MTSPNSDPTAYTGPTAEQFTDGMDALGNKVDEATRAAQLSAAAGLIGSGLVAHEVHNVGDAVGQLDTTVTDGFNALGGRVDAVGNAVSTGFGDLTTHTQGLHDDAERNAAGRHTDLTRRSDDQLRALRDIAANTAAANRAQQVAAAQAAAQRAAQQAAMQPPVDNHWDNLGGYHTIKDTRTNLAGNAHHVDPTVQHPEDVSGTGWKQAVAKAVMPWRWPAFTDSIDPRYAGQPTHKTARDERKKYK